MTTLLIAALAFAAGFFAGDRRGVKQANAILERTWRDLASAMREDDGLPEPEKAEKRPTVPTVH